MSAFLIKYCTRPFARHSYESPAAQDVEQCYFLCFWQVFVAAFLARVKSKRIDLMLKTQMRYLFYLQSHSDGQLADMRLLHSADAKRKQ